MDVQRGTLCSDMSSRMMGSPSPPKKVLFSCEEVNRECHQQTEVQQLFLRASQQHRITNFKGKVKLLVGTSAWETGFSEQEGVSLGLVFPGPQMNKVALWAKPGDGERADPGFLGVLVRVPSQGGTWQYLTEPKRVIIAPILLVSKPMLCALATVAQLVGHCPAK